MKRYLFTLLCLCASAAVSAAGIDTLKVFSPKMQREIPTVVVTPDEAAVRRLPVVYLLHGYSGDEAGLAADHRPAAAGRAVRRDLRLPRRREQAGTGTVRSTLRRSSRPSFRRSARLGRCALPDPAFARGACRCGIEHGRPRRIVDGRAPQGPLPGGRLGIGRRGYPALPRFVGNEGATGRGAGESGPLGRPYGHQCGRFAPGRRTGDFRGLRV